MNTGNMTLVYGAVAVLSVMLLIGYLLFEKKKEEKVGFLVVHPEHIPRIFFEIWINSLAKRTGGWYNGNIQ